MPPASRTTFIAGTPSLADLHDAHIRTVAVRAPAHVDEPALLDVADHDVVLEQSTLPVPLRLLAFTGAWTVMLAVVAAPGVSLDCAELVRRVDAVLPRFARPRYVELVDELPRTPTAKVRKAELRRRAVTPSTWDREAAAADVG